MKKESIPGLQDAGAGSRSHKPHGTEGEGLPPKHAVPE